MKVERVILNCSMDWSMIAQLCSQAVPFRLRQAALLPRSRFRGNLQRNDRVVWFSVISARCVARDRTGSCQSMRGSEVPSCGLAPGARVGCCIAGHSILVLLCKFSVESYAVIETRAWLHIHCAQRLITARPNFSLVHVHPCTGKSNRHVRTCSMFAIWQAGMCACLPHDPEALCTTVSR